MIYQLRHRIFSPTQIRKIPYPPGDELIAARYGVPHAAVWKLAGQSGISTSWSIPLRNLADVRTNTQSSKSFLHQDPKITCFCWGKALTYIHCNRPHCIAIKWSYGYLRFSNKPSCTALRTVCTNKALKDYFQSFSWGRGYLGWRWFIICQSFAMPSLDLLIFETVNFDNYDF